MTGMEVTALVLILSSVVIIVLGIVCIPSAEVKLDDVDGWSVGRRLWNNTVGMLGPLL